MFAETIVTSALLLMGIVLSLSVFYARISFTMGEPLFNIIIPIFFIAISCFIFFKNGYTRADFSHYSEFFLACPAFIVFVLFLYGMDGFRFSKIIACCAITVSVLNLMVRQHRDGRITIHYDFASLSFSKYFSQLFPEKGN